MLKSFGDRLRQIRKEKKITLIELSKKTGVAQATLSRIETGSMTGTLESHVKIAEALGIGLAELYSAVDSRAASISRLSKDDARKVTFQSKNAKIELLTQESSKKKITPLLVTLQPESEMQKESGERGVEKFLFVLQGAVTVKIEKESYELKNDESLYFDASLPHQIANTANREARLLVAVSPSKL
ncbi:MAG: helix-turn-helix domain-containing protein [Candidatus Omnitrophota bacterium]